MLPHNDSLGLYMSGCHASLSRTTSCQFGTAAVELYLRIGVHNKLTHCTGVEPAVTLCFPTVHTSTSTSKCGGLVSTYSLQVGKPLQSLLPQLILHCGFSSFPHNVCHSVCTLVPMPKSDTTYMCAGLKDIRSI